MREIQSFAFSRTYPDARPNVNQDAIVSSAPADNGLTDLFCDRGWEVCMFETILFAAFYHDTGTVAGSGIASMQFGGSGARRLRTTTNNRSLQDADQEAAVAEFELDFETVATVDEGTSGATSNMMGLVSVALLAVGSAATLL